MFGLVPWLLQAAEIEGIKLADSTRVTALYLQQKRSMPDAIIGDVGAKRVALHMLRDIGAEQLFSALNDGLKANHAPEQLAKLETQTREFEAIFKKVQSVKTGDIVLLDCLPGAGTRVTVNGDARGVIAGAEFYMALLRIWLGDKPAEAGLKKALLGG